MTYVLGRVVGQATTEREASNTDVSQSTSHNDLVGLSGHLVYITPASSWANDKVLAIASAHGRGKVWRERDQNTILDGVESGSGIVATGLQSILDGWVLVELLDSVGYLIGVRREEDAGWSILVRVLVVPVDRIDVVVFRRVADRLQRPLSERVVGNVLGVLGVEVVADCECVC